MTEAFPSLGHLWTDSSPTFVVYRYMSLFPDKLHVVHASPTESGLHIGHAEYGVRGFFRRRVEVGPAADRIVSSSVGPDLDEYFQDLLDLLPHEPEKQTEYWKSYPPEGQLVTSVRGRIREYDFNHLRQEDPIRLPTYCLSEAIQRYVGATPLTPLGPAESLRTFCKRFGIAHIPSERGIPSLADRFPPSEWATFCIENWDRILRVFVLAQAIDAMLISVRAAKPPADLNSVRDALLLAQTDPDTCLVLNRHLGETNMDPAQRMVIDLINDTVDAQIMQRTMADAKRIDY